MCASRDVIGHSAAMQARHRSHNEHALFVAYVHQGLCCAPGARERVPSAPGTRRRVPRGQMSDDREGEGSEGWVLPCEPVHGCLERAIRAARRRLPLTWRMGQVRGDPVCERAPESRTGSAGVGLLYSQSVWGQFVYFDVFDEFRGVKNRWHGDTPCLRMLPIHKVWGLPPAEQPVHRHWCGVGRGTVLNGVCIISTREYRLSQWKRKTHCFHTDQKKE